ncbi:MAG: phytoene/squalene synthase family protein [Alsobacter sp.]
MAKPIADPRLAADYVACRERIRLGSRSFFAASLLLPKSVRWPASALYAFCRLSDDAVDGPGAQRDAVERLQARLDALYAGRPGDDPADRAFADVVERYDMPKALPEALLDGLAWDAAGRHYLTLEHLLAYAARVAAAVGAMMTVLMERRDRTVLARACDLGVAMQLTNIARDVGEDARNGRIYLPLAWCDEVGLDPVAFLARPVFDERVRAMVERLLAEADALYERAGPGVAGLPAGCRPAIQAARLIYREIGWRLRRAGGDSVSVRTVVPDGRKVALLGRAIAAAAMPGRMAQDPPLAQTRYLVDSAARAHAPAAAPWQVIDERVGWMIEVLGSLERRQLEASAAAPRALARRDLA